MRLVHRDEPLGSSAKNDRVLATPTMGVPVIVVFREQEHSSLPHELDDLFVGFKHTLSRKVFDFRSKSSCVIDGTINFQAIAFADNEVVVTMTWCSMHCARSCFAIGRFLLCLTYVKFS